MALESTSPVLVGWNMGPRINRPRMNGIRTVANMIAARPRRPIRKCPDPGTNQAKATVNQGELAGAVVPAVVEVAGIDLILAGKRLQSFLNQPRRRCAAR